MADMEDTAIIALVVATTVAFLLFDAIILLLMVVRRRNLHRWLPEYCFPSEPRPERDESDPVDVFIALCDHFEPRGWGADHEQGLVRVSRWCDEYPKLFGSFRDSRGQVPQHSFFFPAEEYHAEYLDRLSELCGRGYGDVEIHLHHDNDTPEALHDKLASFRDLLFYRHGLLRCDSATGRIRYGFIHGNWALCNSRPDGRWCGVDNEIPILCETGCYADLTMPSAPDATQTRTLNSIYYAIDQPGRSKSHDRGIRARVGDTPPGKGLLMIQGPLALDWRHRKFGVLPRIQDPDLHALRPPTLDRFHDWLRVGVHVAGKPEWVFIKLHTHGCKDGNIDKLLGPAMQQFHADLAAYARARPSVRYHYVTAWEMAQLVHQAEQDFARPQFSRMVCQTDPEFVGCGTSESRGRQTEEEIRESANRWSSWPTAT